MSLHSVIPNENIEFELGIDIEHNVISMDGSLTDTETVGKTLKQVLDSFLDGEYDIYIVRRE